MSKDGRPWLFPELDRSFKQIFLLQMFAVLGLLGIVAGTFGWLWAFIGLCIMTLIWCGMIQAGINAARTREISLATQDRMAEQRANFPNRESRLLDRSTMELPAPPPPPRGTELAPEDYGV